MSQSNRRIAKFQKVSFEQFKSDLMDKWENIRFHTDDESESVTEEMIRDIYDGIRLPERATKGSAGYDFFSPIGFTLKPGETIVFPTGIRVSMEESWMLSVFPRSGLGFKYRLQLDNTVGIIDSDYYGSTNEGHIMIKITNDSKKDSDPGKKTVKIKSGTAVAQGVFLQYGLTVDDSASDIRDGGFGSTGI